MCTHSTNPILDPPLERENSEWLLFILYWFVAFPLIVIRRLLSLNPRLEGIKWCPQHGYPEPCAKCKGMTKEEWDKFYESLLRAVSKEIVCMCVECGKGVSGKEAEGSIKHPYCKKCFKKTWNDDYEAYFQFLHTTHQP